MPLHPSIVHFPPVLLLAAAVLYTLGILRKAPQMQLIAFGFHVAGLVFCILAIFTGDYEADRIATDPALKALMERHENLVMMATYGFGMLGLWAFLRQKTTLGWERIAFLGAFVGLLTLLLVGAHQGGRMVFVHGAGTAPAQIQKTSPSPETHP